MLLLGYLIAMYTCSGLCTGSGVTFVERNSFVKLRSEGLANIGYVGSRGPDDYVSKMSVTFGKLRLLTPLDAELFKTLGGATFDIQPSGFHRHRNMNVHGMSMDMNIPALGIVLTMKGAILKQNGRLRVGDDADVSLRRGDVMLALELTPAFDDQTCIACQVDVGYVIELEFDVTHTGNPEFRELGRSVSVLRSYEYSDGSRLYIPEQVFIDGVSHPADLAVAGSENNHNVVMRLPAPLGQKMEMNVVFKMAKPTPPTTPTPTIVVERERQGEKRDGAPGDNTRQTDARSRDQVNLAEDEREIKVLEVHVTTTKAAPARTENGAKSAMAGNDNINGCTKYHNTSVILMVLFAIFVLLV